MNKSKLKIPEVNSIWKYKDDNPSYYRITKVVVKDESISIYYQNLVGNHFGACKDLNDWYRSFSLMGTKKQEVDAVMSLIQIYKESNGKHSENIRDELRCVLISIIDNK